MASASSWSCVTMIVVTPSRRCSARISWRSDWRTRASSAESGSSRSSSAATGPGRGPARCAAARRPRAAPGTSACGPAAPPGRAARRRGPRSAPADLARLEPVAHVAGHREIREEGVGLEDDAVVALAGRQRGDVAPAHHHEARVLALEPRDDPQQRGLAAAARSQEADELAGREDERDAAQGRELSRTSWRCPRGPPPRAGRSPRSSAAPPRALLRHHAQQARPVALRLVRRRCRGPSQLVQASAAGAARCRGACGRWRR